MRSVVPSADPSANLLGSSLIGLGVVLLLYALGMHLDLVPGGRVSVPPPVALERPRPGAAVTAAPTVDAVPAQTQLAMPRPAFQAAPASDAPPSSPPVIAASRSLTMPEHATPDLDLAATLARPDPAVYAAPMAPADAADRNRPPPGAGVQLRIPSIKLTSDVKTAGIVENARGQLEWETVPFVAAHYVDTALVGSRGNAVMSGHVVTLYEGNVFRNLYQVEFGSIIEVDTPRGTFAYEVDDIRVVLPTDTDVMEPSPEPRLTLITCGGEFNPRTTQFSHRLIVGGRLVDWSRRAGD